MATLVLQTAGQAIGSAFGGPVGGAIARAAGAIAGSIIDQALLAPPTRDRHRQGPRLADLQVTASNEGAPIPRVWGRARLAGQVIWATNLEEVASTETTRAGSGGKAGQRGPSTTVTTYTYFANFAVALAEAPLTRIGRVWADGKEIDLSRYTTRFYTGAADQQPDSLIVAKQGAGNAPAYRGIAYIVFERLPLAEFGNRIPQLSFEVFRALDDVEGLIRAVNIIPGSTEFGYDPEVVTRTVEPGHTASENAHVSQSDSDWTRSIDQLTATCANLEAAALVVAWFGDDLRCGECRLRPGVDLPVKQTTPHQWSVAGLTRGEAHQVSQIDGKPAFGGSPDDGSLVRAITDLKARGLEVTLSPFIMMDIPPGNALTNPVDGGAGQPAYPWRGDITCDPAPGAAGSPERTAAIASQIAAFVGSAAPADFSIASGKVVYTGPDEWSLRRMVLHYAHLAALAGGVDVFLIASELKGLTRLRDEADGFPFVAALKALAGDVAQVLPSTRISYAADWSEYFGFQPDDGSGDVYFNLDALWADANIHFIGIDNYMPLSDWRDGDGHADILAGAHSIYDLDYLRGRIEGGEGFDWYYASDADRQAQARTAITDGAYAKPWVFRYKDIAAWWANPHYPRSAGIEAASPTAWVPQSKPVRFTEAGCPALDKGANEPNAFCDPKSAQSRLPHFSSGARDDFMQRRFIEALLTYWQDSANNPLSNVYGGPMIEVQRTHLWAWDARPFPAFPSRADVWSDAVNYACGHWLNGRAGAVPVGPLVASLCQTFAFDAHDVSELEGVIDGYVVERIMSARQAIEPLAEVFAFDAVEDAGVVRFVSRRSDTVASFTADDLVETAPDNDLITLTRAQQSELPRALKLTYSDPAADYRLASAEALIGTDDNRNQHLVGTAMVMSQALAKARAEVMLNEIWVGRESLRCILPPSALSLEPGDVIDIAAAGSVHRVRIDRQTMGDGLEIACRRHEASLYEPHTAPTRGETTTLAAPFGVPRVHFMHLPVIRSSDNPYAPWLAASAVPWPGRLNVLRDTGGGQFDLAMAVSRRAVIGDTLDDLPAGPLWRFDRANRVRVRLLAGELQSVSRERMLNGGNIAAIGDELTGWEVIQFQNALLVAPDTYELATLLRGQVGSAAEMLPLRPAGAAFVFLDEASVQLPLADTDFGRDSAWRIGPAQFDHGHQSFAAKQVQAIALGLRPLPPVHLSARVIAGDIHLTWIRQTRVGGDGWAQVEVPLGETGEAYAITILTATGVAVRQETVTAPSFIYNQAQQTADFGSPVTGPLRFSIAQISSSYGPGIPTEATIDV